MNVLSGSAHVLNQDKRRREPMNNKGIDDDPFVFTGRMLFCTIT